MERWVKYYESILEWEWSSDPAMMALWSRLLVMAQYRDREYRDMTIKRGQVLTSIRKLSEESGISVRTVRTCLERLEATQQITRKPTHHSTLITICNYDKYQDKRLLTDTPNDTPTDKQVTHDRHTNSSRKIENNNIYNSRREDTRTHEEVLEEFVGGQIYFEAFCKNEGIDPETCKRLAKEVINDWYLTGQTHTDNKDAKDHLLRHLRIKINIYKQKQKDNEETPTDRNIRRRGSDTSATRTEDYEDSF